MIDLLERMIVAVSSFSTLMFNMFMPLLIDALDEEKPTNIMKIIKYNVNILTFIFFSRSNDNLSKCKNQLTRT